MNELEHTSQVLFSEARQVAALHNPTDSLNPRRAGALLLVIKFWMRLVHTVALSGGGFALSSEGGAWRSATLAHSSGVWRVAAPRSSLPALSLRNRLQLLQTATHTHHASKINRQGKTAIPFIR